MSKIVVAFDLYGTLLSTQSIAEELAKHFGSERATAIATAWRKYQLEYTWRLNSMSIYYTDPALPSRPWNCSQFINPPSPLSLTSDLEPAFTI